VHDTDLKSIDQKENSGPLQ